MFGFNKDKKTAEYIVSTSRLIALSSLSIFIDKYPVLRNLFKNPNNTNDWDFFFTVAGVHIAVRTMDINTPQKTAKNLGSYIRKELDSWNIQGVDAYSDLSNFVSKNMDNGIDYGTSIGTWIIWNIKKSQPSQEEFTITKKIGQYLIDIFKDMWTKIK